MRDSDNRVPGHFRWNRGGWFGGQIGGTFWLLLLGAALLAQGRFVGVVPLVLGLLCNVVGLLLWRPRKTLSAYPALQLIVGCCGLSAVISLLAISATGQLQRTFHSSQGFWFLLVFPGLMLMFHLQGRIAGKERAEQGGETGP